MFKPEIILTQNSEVIENLVNSEEKLNELNQRLGELATDYQTVANNIDQPSFFNVENIYFWFVICGLLLVAFGLWFWLVELKNPSTKKQPKEKPAKKKKKITKADKKLDVIVEKTQPRIKKGKSFKVPVRKVK